MVMRDIRELAHEMVDDDEVSEIIEKMRHLKSGQNKRANEDALPFEEPTDSELRAIENAQNEFQNGEFYSRKDVFGEEGYV